MPRAPAMTFIADTRQAMALMNRTQRAVAGPSLGAFLAGTVDVWLRQRAASRFASEGDDIVGKWAPLRAATVNFREAEGFPGPHPINVRTGELEEFITGQPGSLAVTQNSAVLTKPGSQPSGDLMDKFGTAQQGKNEPRTVPRPVLGVGVSDLEYVMTALDRHLTMAIASGVGS